jgi:hypothetical protein
LSNARRGIRFPSYGLANSCLFVFIRGSLVFTFGNLVLSRFKMRRLPSDKTANCRGWL